MDYLQEGINLRAMGQKDPLTEWQREGFEMFGALMKGVAQDFVKYVMHVQVVSEQAPAAVTTTQQVQNLTTSGASAPATPSGAKPGTSSATLTRSADDWSRTPRNAPCPCGSGKKYKQCHGKVA
jgi:preprotein translocase subunit SecA